MFAWVYNSDFTITNYDTAVYGGKHFCLTGGPSVTMQPRNTTLHQEWDLSTIVQAGPWCLTNVRFGIVVIQICFEYARKYQEWKFEPYNVVGGRENPQVDM